MTGTQYPNKKKGRVGLCYWWISCEWQVASPSCL